MEDRIDDDVLEGLNSSRRTFVKSVLAGTAFAAPFIASYDMKALTQLGVGTAQANSTS